MSTSKIREEVRTLLLTTGCNDVVMPPRTDTGNYPYITFEIHEFSSDYGKTLCQLEINCVGRGKSVDIDNMADEVQDLMNQYQYIDQGVLFRLFKATRNIVEEEDKEIVRRRLLFDLHIYE